MSRILKIFAPAKINLFLHVTGRRDDGYHLLDSLTGFADIGDDIQIKEASDFSFQVDGPYAGSFRDKELDSSPHSSNLAVRAAWLLARDLHKTLDVQITLTKNLPLAAGIGGGSADAAAILWGLLEWWGCSKSADIAENLMPDLGADLPVCFYCKPARVQGIGENLEWHDLPEIPVVLVNPQILCSTRDVFLRHSGSFTTDIPHLPKMEILEHVFSVLQHTRNDLLDAACDTVPVIHNILQALKSQTECRLARLSGSGATCFGLFPNSATAQMAAENISEQNPDWWVRAGVLNRVERY